MWDDTRTWWKIDLDIGATGDSLLPILLNREIQSINSEIWMLVVCLVWWHIWKARNVVIFQGLQVDQNAIINLVKREALNIGIMHGWISSKVANLWYWDPNQALANYSLSKHSTFMSKLFNTTCKGGK